MKKAITIAAAIIMAGTLLTACGSSESSSEETAAGNSAAVSEMRAAYKVGFKDGATMMQEIQD